MKHVPPRLNVTQPSRAALASPDRLDDLDPAVVELVKALARAAVTKEIRRLRKRDSEACLGTSGLSSH
jgi:hypothetical protein